MRSVLSVSVALHQAKARIMIESYLWLQVCQCNGLYKCRSTSCWKEGAHLDAIGQMCPVSIPHKLMGLIVAPI